MRIIETEVFEENGIKYQRDIYDNGATVTYPWVDPDEPIPEPEPEPTPQPSENDLIMSALTDIYEQNESLQESNLLIMSALTDIYEGESTS